MYLRSKQRKPKPKLERRYARKDYDYDASSSSSSFSEGYGAPRVTRSLEIDEKRSFRVGGGEGEFDRICMSLGLSGPEDFAIPESAWEAMKVRSSSDVFPRSRIDRTKSPCLEEMETVVHAQVVQVEKVGHLLARFRDEEVKVEPCRIPNEVRGGGLVGARPAELALPPGRLSRKVDDGSSTWDLLRGFAPEGEDSESAAQLVREGHNGACSSSADADELVEEAAARMELCSVASSYDGDRSGTSTATGATPSASPNVRFRQIIAGWIKGQLLGRGSYGSVYEAMSVDGFFFAIKEVSLVDQGSQARQSVWQLEQEIDLLSQFEHENIVRYHGTDKDESNLYIFLELVSKGSLASLHQRYELKDSQVSVYTRQILQGLKYLHDRDLVHRDIKCANILVDADGSVKLADFGLAKAAKLNDVKSCKGTAFWMAPEVVNRKNQGYGRAADIWSLGCTVLEMLTQKTPYYPLECMQALFRIGRGMPPDVPEKLSVDARDFILKCIQVNPDNRPTAAQLLDHPFVKKLQPTTLGTSLPDHFKGRA
uniref:mitogen-activated protein kinase kinase kinase n=1 Tax=Kalanchoe fedtschenkoi TaxID=63787 RepID=A0A7N0UN47_KALFE